LSKRHHYRFHLYPIRAHKPRTGRSPKRSSRKHSGTSNAIDGVSRCVMPGAHNQRDSRLCY
jgi:hypothetical protein